MNWQDLGHLYAAVVGFSAGAWLMITYHYSQSVLAEHGRAAWRVAVALLLGVGALVIFSAAVATAINNPKSDVPTWRLALYWLAVGMADVALVLLLAWDKHRYGGAR